MSDKLVRICNRVGNSEADNDDFIPALGEIVINIDDIPMDKSAGQCFKAKVGDGKTSFRSLKYMNEGLTVDKLDDTIHTSMLPYSDDNKITEGEYSAIVSNNNDFGKLQNRLITHKQAESLIKMTPKRFVKIITPNDYETCQFELLSKVTNNGDPFNLSTAIFVGNPGGTTTLPRNYMVTVKIDGFVDNIFIYDGINKTYDLRLISYTDANLDKTNIPTIQLDRTLTRDNIEDSEFDYILEPWDDDHLMRYYKQNMVIIVDII